MDRDTILEIVSLLKNKENVLICAPGGTGKSHAIREIALELQDQGEEVACTATTGVASLNLAVPGRIGPSTLHRWAGIKLGTDTPENYVRKIYPDARKRWQDTDVLAIDEISMMGMSVFDKLDTIGKLIRRNIRPFGGIALLVGGDFLQLPPVKDDWVFKSKAWNDCAFSVYILSSPMRYEDTDYYDLLLRVREGKQTTEDLDKLEERVDGYMEYLQKSKTEKNLMTIKPTILYSKKVNVELHNNVELGKLPTESKEFKSHDAFFCHEKIKPAILSILDDAIPRIIHLKIGAQVMLMRNIDTQAGLVNGSRGVVTWIADDISLQNTAALIDSNVIEIKYYNGQTRKCPLMKWEIEEKGEVVASRIQIPFICAWALTMHKSQGCTLDFAVCDIGESVFAPGQAYVALSRVRSLKGLLLSNFQRKAIKVDKEALEYVHVISGD